MRWERDEAQKGQERPALISATGQRPRGSPARVRAELARRLQERRAEIEEAILTRMHAVSTPSGEEDAEYLDGLGATVEAAIDYGLAAIGEGEEGAGPVPAAMLLQARHAVRNRVGLETVLRRYFAGYTALGDFLMHEAREGELSIDSSTLHLAQRELAALFDRMVASVSAEYARASERSVRHREDRLADRVKRLLAGELVDVAELGYDFSGWHLGAIATGSDTEYLLRDLAQALDRQILLVPGGEWALWCWFGGRHRLGPSEFVEALRAHRPHGASLAIGEPALGLRGWRLTHRQAMAAAGVSRQRPQPLTRYADIALLSAMLRDVELTAFLSDAYIGPLREDRDGGVALCETLQAYFAVGRNGSSAAAVLGVSRQTITNRLHAIEERIDRSLNTCLPELEGALRLAEFEHAPFRLPDISSDDLAFSTDAQP